MRPTKQYRQQVSTFQADLDKILAVPEAARSGRLIVDRKGYQTRAIATKSQEQRMALYGYERCESVARVLGLFEIMRDLESLHSRTSKITATPSGAVWQAFRGTEDSNACHTCPTHLQLNGQLPTMQTRNVALQRHIVIEFANCILMPRGINLIDKIFDDNAGKLSFAEAAEVVLCEPGATWNEGFALFRESVRDFLGPARDVLFDTSGKNIVLREADDQQKVDMLSAYYEGMFLVPINVSSIETMVNETKTEVGRETAAGYFGSQGQGTEGSGGKL